MSSKVRPHTAVDQKTKERLKTLLKRENHRGLLIKKFKTKYGTTPHVAEIINRLVTEYVKKVPHITEESLGKLDRDILAKIQTKPEAKKEGVKDPLKTTAQIASEILS